MFVIGEAKHFQIRVLIDTVECECMHDILLPKGMCSESRERVVQGYHPGKLQT